jgi:hypothetical protein
LPVPQQQNERNPILLLQRALGNQAVQRSLNGSTPGTVLQRKCASCEEEEQKKMQTKLAINTPGDAFEQEADRVADAVVSNRVPAAPRPMPASSRVQRCSCSAGRHQCEQCKAQAASESGPVEESSAPPAVSEVLNSPGATLQRSLREDLEGRFGGHDFSHVRVHTDARAAASARSVNALAYTVGNHVVFGSGQYSPGTRSGQHLLAHELTHVLQQQGSSAPAIQSKLAIGGVNDAAEHEAEKTAKAVASGPARAVHPVQVTHTGASVRRVYTTPQRADEVRIADEGLPDHGSRHVMRYIAICPCHQVDDPQSGVFANPDVDDLVLVYRRCSGRHTWDYFGRLQSNASTALQVPSAPQGTARGGVTGHLGGDQTSGRIDANILGGNEVSGGQAGGQLRGVIEQGGWTFFLSAEYRRNLQPPTGTDRNQFSGEGAFCPPGLPFCIGAEGTIHDPTRGDSFLVTARSRSSIPQIDRDTCRTCICPRRLAYSCWEDHPENTHPEDVQVTRTLELRYYFAWNSSEQESEAEYLRDASRRNFRKAADLLRTGRYQILMITGYASPEGAEAATPATRSGFAGNQPLSDARATSTARRLRTFLNDQGLANVTVPASAGGAGELLGRRPAPSPSSQLNEIMSDAGFHDAEEISVFLMGSEIGNRDLESQFRALLSDPRMTPDLQMELFGLEHNDPARPQVTAAVAAFLATPRGTTSRPWDGIFRLFRYGVVFLRGTETETQDVTTPGHSDTLDESPCRDHGRRLTRAGAFGPINPQTLEAQIRPRDEDTECAREEGEARDEDCRYVPPPHTPDPLSAPDIAPQRLDQP